jgi:hypothetical protein
VLKGMSDRYSRNPSVGHAQLALNRVRKDNDFTNLMRALFERDKQILERLAE